MDGYIEKFFRECSVDPSNAAFFQKVFSFIAKRGKKRLMKENPPCRAIFEEYNDVSWRLDRTAIQEGCAVRNVLLTRELARCLIGEHGEVEKEGLDEIVTLLKEHTYPLGPARQYDAERREWILKALEMLQSDAELVRLLHSISQPHSNLIADQLIRDTVGISEKEKITIQHVRQAALSAWLCYLRQSVGSCFGTAPAIIVHNEQPKLFFEDLTELLATGQIKRTFGGIEYSAPLSTTFGAGDLKRLFFVSVTHPSDLSEPWLSPGIITAFVAADLIELNQKERAKAQESKKLIIKLLKKFRPGERQVMISAEELIRIGIMDQLELTEKDIKEVGESAPGMMQSQMIAHVTSQVGGGGKKRLYEKLLKIEKKATVAFKAIADNALLKAWEFTLASFAETKPAFTRWNLYSSLGLSAGEPGGIGECLVRLIQESLDRQNAESEELGYQYDQLEPGIRYAETRMRTATTEEEIKWLKIDYNAKVTEFRAIEEMVRISQNKAHWYANLFNTIMHHYDRLFSQYFQEVYDADMHVVATSAYDDSPAGFRLLYKHGRTNTALWSRIFTPDEFIDSLSNFFIVSERDIATYPEFEGCEKELTELVTEIVKHVKTKEFLETAFDRMAKAHKTVRIEDPLNNLDKIEKKPWVYTSGGSLDNLVKCYYRIENDLTKVSRWVENPTELFVFLVDTVREMPQNTLQEFKDDPEKALLIHSPTHAFLLKPGRSQFRGVWETDAYTYTWVRDELILPREHFIDRLMLDAPKMQFIIELLAQKIHANYRHYFRRVFGNLWGIMNPVNLRREIVKLMSKEKGLQFSGSSVLSLDDLDSTLYNHLPLIETRHLQEKVLQILEQLEGISKADLQRVEEILPLYEKKLLGIRILSNKQLRDICLSILLLLFKETAYSQDYHKLVANAMRKTGNAFHAPVIIADTNWVKDKFAFVVNPGTGKFEFWRTDKNGNEGFPIHAWDQWLNGSRKDREWGVYTRPGEYIAAPKGLLFSRI